MKRLLGTLALAVQVASAAHAAQLRNDTFRLAAQSPTVGVDVTVPAAEARQGLRIEVFSAAAGQILNLTARNPLGRVRSASGSGRVTLMVSSDDMVARPGFPLTFHIEVGPASGFAPGVTAVDGQLVVWSGPDVRPPPPPMLQPVTPRAKPEPRAVDPDKPTLLKALPPGKP